MFLPLQTTPIVVELVNKPTPQVSLTEVLIEAIGLTGVVFVSAAVFGVLFGGALIWYKFKRPGARESTPPASDYGFRLSNFTEAPSSERS